MTRYKVGKGNGVQIVRHSKYISYDIYISRKCNYWNLDILEQWHIKRSIDSVLIPMITEMN